MEIGLVKEFIFAYNVFIDENIPMNRMTFERHGRKEIGFMGKLNKIRKQGKQRGALQIQMKSVAVLFAYIFFTMALSSCQSDRAMELEFSKKEETDGSAQGDESLFAGEEPEPDKEIAQELVVHVCGAVKEPGVKVLPAGSRAADALEMAGGFTDEADTAYVNLAAFLEDGQQLYFPKDGEELRDVKEMNGLIDLNTADAAQLCSLPGIGESRANAILAYRREHGKFTRVEELLQVPGIKDALYQQIRDKVKVLK